VYQDAIPERDAHAQRHCDETQQRGAKRIEGCDPFEIQARSWVPFDDQGRWQ
jgi:cytosine/adenosine deaminase-related metal-dependent hydrolase